MVELIWDGKYDANGKRTAPVRIALPFQTVETVNESAQQRQRTLDLFSAGRDPEWRNRLIWGDKKYVLPALLEEFAGKVDLVYIDPPFATGDNFSFQAQVGDETFEKEPNIIEAKAYRDTWGRGLDSYLQWFYEAIIRLQEMLSEQGCIYVHCDWRLNSAIRLVLDEVFGEQNLINEIVWKRSNPHNDTGRYGAIHDTLLLYSKTENYVFNTQYSEPSEEYIRSHFTQIDEQTGERFTLMPLMASGPGPARQFGNQILTPPPGTHWRWTQEKIDEGIKNGLIVFTSGGTPRYKFYESHSKGRPLQSVWDDIIPINSQSNERVNYPTQKPESLLERIITTSSKEGDLVLDCFCGSGTTAAVAEKLGRRWITCDLGRFAIHTARKRLLGIEGVRPFVVQNLGKYERQVWQKAEFGESAESRLRAYRSFILDLYHAEPMDGYAWLHGMKAGRLVHVGTVDAPIAQNDVSAIAGEFRKVIGMNLTPGPSPLRREGGVERGVDVLGWDFALDANETIRQTAQAAGIDVRFVRIPREVLEKKAVEQGDIQFFELAALSVDVQTAGRAVQVALTDFMVPPDDVPKDVIAAVRKWSEWIDYWAVDWNFRDDTFHNEWQSYRTRKDRSLQLSVVHEYTEPGDYTIVIKAIDILGNDTTKAVTVRVG